MVKQISARGLGYFTHFIKICGSFCSFNCGFKIVMFCLSEQMVKDITLMITRSLSTGNI